jgi:hypothetical protein
MKKLAVMFLLLCCNNVYGADSTIVKFMNSIYKQVIDTNYLYYYVLDEAKNPQVDANHLYNFKRSMPQVFKDVPLKDFLIGINADTLSFLWHSYPLPKARYVDRGHLPKNVGLTRVFKFVPINTHQTAIDSLEKEGIIPIRTKPNTSAKQAEKLIKRWKKLYDSRPKEDKNFYIFSKPIFTADKQYALITVDEVGQGCTYIFKKENERWLIISAIRWIA